MLEERSYLEEFLAKAISPNIGGVQVVIGGENFLAGAQGGVRVRPAMASPATPPAPWACSARSAWPTAAPFPPCATSPA